MNNEGNLKKVKTEILSKISTHEVQSNSAKCTQEYI